MERIKKLRTPQRALLTKVIKGAEAELEKEECNKQSLYEKLEQVQRCMTDLRVMDGKYREAMLDEEATEGDILMELERIEEYEAKYTSIRSRIEQMLAPPMPRPGSPLPSEHSMVSANDIKRRTFKLPQIELRKFNAELKEWLGWWSQFSKIHDDEFLHESDKFHYLVQAMEPGTEARDLVCSYPQTAENYAKAVEALKERFGRPTLLVQVYIRELLQLVIMNVHAEDKLPMDQLYLMLESHLRSLATLNLTAADPATWLYPLVESSLPEDVMRAWQRSSMSKRDGAQEEPKRTKLDILMEFLKAEVQAEQQITLAKAGFRSNKIGPDPKKETTEKGKPQSKREKSDIPTASSLHAGSKSGCLFCGKDNHSSTDCYAARKMNLEQRQAKVKEARRCFNCLKIGHPAAKCKSPAQCYICKKRHHSLLCQGKTEKKEEHVEEAAKAMSVMTTTADGFLRSCQRQGVFMKTIRVKVRGSSGIEKEVRLLFDDGSQRSYMKTGLAKELRCVKVGELVIQNCLFGGQVTGARKRNRYLAIIGGACAGYQNISQETILLGEAVLTGPCPCVPAGPWVEELAQKKIRLNDSWSHSSDADILIGSDLWGRFMTGRMMKLKSGLVAVESIFGWTLSGEISSLPADQSIESAASVITTMLYSVDVSLPNLWSLETIGITDSAEKVTQAEHDMNVKKALQVKMTRNQDGRYVVRLPWIDDGLTVPTNKDIAEKRLVSCTKRLTKEEFRNYDKVFRDWEMENIIEREDRGASKGHFLPHRPVFKEESVTTPVRPVFDASCRGRQGPSLNDCLEKGPNLLELLPSVLLRFREKEIGVTSDIRKAFQMIAVDERDRDYQKFLWWEKDQETMMQYRHCRVVFGVNCSPFILAAVLEWHLEHVCIEDKRVAAELLKSLYVDNSVTSFDTVQQYEEFQGSTTRILADAKMELRQWEVSHAHTDKKVTTVLGMLWDKEEDEIYCQVPGILRQMEENFEVTKRSVLSITARVFDPIGIICPAMVLPKRKLQASWAKDVRWDEPWDPKESQKFRMWCQEASVLSRIHVPRWAFGGSGHLRQVELHCFTDASQDIYAAVVFARVETEREVTVQLLMAKARLAPLAKEKGKRVTIPRLELLGCLIGARLTRTVKEALTREDIPVTIWSDSTTALAWIERDEDWGTFVGNRVREIKKLSDGWAWKHVSGENNPADLPSRGCSPAQLLESRWWEGPAWLRKPADTWIHDTSNINEEDIYSERKKTASHIATEIPEPKFSSYGKNIRVAAYVRRFVDNLKKSRAKEVLELSSCLTVEEINRAEHYVLAEIQKRHFKKGQKLSGLWIQKGQDGLLHVKTRLDLKQDWDAFKYPILLPNRDPMVEQLIRETHKKMGHAGTQVVLNCLREKYWIMKGRWAVNQVLRQCVICRRHQVKKMTTLPSPLPRERVETQFAFQTTGVDLAGPVLLKHKKKVWIVLYTCAVYRGVYLDWVPSLGVKDFMDSLEKFCCEVGRPNTLYSDNGTNFVAAASLLKKMDWSKMRGPMEAKGIRWIFNPPCAAWWGGWWERLIGNMKNLLRKMLGTACLHSRDLTKCLAAVAHVMNSRPLTTVTEDPNDLRPLTPFMFMRDLPVSGLPEPDKVTQPDLQKTFVKISQLKEALKSRFRKEYLATLIQKRNETKTTVPHVGDVVFLEVPNKKRCEWPLARIVELYPGKDGEIRVARIKVRDGVMTRPLQRLYPLEVPVRADIVTEEPLERPEAHLPHETVETQGEEPTYTRAGRKVARPNRYGSWNYS